MYRQRALSLRKKLTRKKEYKENGNAAFKRGEIDDAIDAYKRALDEEDTDEALRKACFGNLAACFLAQQKNKECVEACTNGMYHANNRADACSARHRPRLCESASTACDGE